MAAAAVAGEVGGEGAAVAAEEEEGEEMVAADEGLAVLALRRTSPHRCCLIPGST